LGAYEETLAWLSSLEVSSGWDLKLERMSEALARRRHPEARWPALHVAGTNGKGSTAAMLDAILTAAGHRTGLYTSPHLVDFTERMRVGGRTIPRETVVAIVDELRADLGSAGIGLTHFEFATLVAFEWFARVGIDVGVIEVGLGGRLDATNLVHPAGTAITSIGIDHVEYLGNDVGTIAGEKAGILKPGVPLALGPVPPEAETVIVARARDIGAPVARVGVDGAIVERPHGLAFEGRGVVWDGLRLALPGRFQRDNAAVALLLLALARDRFRCSPAAVRRGLEAVRWPGRLAVVGADPLIVLDGAHNPAGVAALVRELPGLVGSRPLDLVFAAMADKNWGAMLAPLLPLVRRAIVTRVGRRGAPPDEIARACAARVPVEAMDDAPAALRAALARVGSGEAVLVTGSLFLVGEAYAALARAGVLGRLFEPWKAPGSGGTEAGA
jgi:dihydrofolate synthase / folylpolyglutamate synthase